MLYQFGIAITFFLLFLLVFGKERKTSADVVLTCWLAVIGVHLFLFYLFISNKIYSYPWLLGLHFPIPLLHGPLLYLYAGVLTGKFELSNKKNLLHFIPALLCYVYLINFIQLPAEQKILIYKNKGAGYETFQSILTSFVIISGIGYCMLTILLHRAHKKNILNQFSYTEKINLDWIQYLMYGSAVIWLCVINGNDAYVFGAVVFFVLFMGYFGITQVGVFTPSNNPNDRSVVIPKEDTIVHTIDEKDFAEDKQKDDDTVQKTDNAISGFDMTEENSNQIKKKYSRSGLTDEAESELHEKLNHTIQSEKIFKRSELTLTELAKHLGTHPNYLSQVINNKENKNFYDYINTLRVEEFVKVVSNSGNNKFTLLSLAFECGFNSKSSFNKYFRKVKGLSPSEFLSQVNSKKRL